MPITISKGSDRKLAFKSWDFPDGGVGVRLDTDNLRYRNLNHPSLYGGSIGEQTITARIQSARDIMELVMVVDALRRWDLTPIKLVMPTCPYARQDRACVKGEAFSLKAFAALINGLEFAKVITLDAHSGVVEAVFDRIEVVSQGTIIGKFDALNARLIQSNVLLVSPDAGANKKTADLAAHYGHDRFIRADKLRDLATGNIKETVVYADDLSGVVAVICDDLCDGGRTFIDLAKALKAKGAAAVELYVTHAILSKGIDVLMTDIDHLYITTAYQTAFMTETPIATRVSVLDIETPGLLPL